MSKGVPGCGRGSNVTSPVGVIRPMFWSKLVAYHRLPSGPVVIDPARPAPLNVVRCRVGEGGRFSALGCRLRVVVGHAQRVLRVVTEGRTRAWPRSSRIDSITLMVLAAIRGGRVTGGICVLVKWIRDHPLNSG